MNPLHPDPQALRLRQEFGQNSKHIAQSQTPSLMITTKKKKKNCEQDPSESINLSDSTNLRL